MMRAAIVLVACARPSPTPAPVAGPAPAPPDAAPPWRPPEPYAVTIAFDTPDEPVGDWIVLGSARADTPPLACASAKDDAYDQLLRDCGPNRGVATLTGVTASCTCEVDPHYDITTARVRPTVDASCSTSLGGTCSDDDTRVALGADRSETRAIDVVRGFCRVQGRIGVGFGSTCTGDVCVATGRCE